MRIYTMLKTGVKSCFFVGKKLDNPIVMEDELSGKSNVIKDMCVESKKADSLWVVPTALVLDGDEYNSAIVIDRGKLVGTTDMTHGKRNVTLGNTLIVHSTTRGKIGIMIEEDIGYFEVARELKLMGADILLMIGGSSLMAEAHSITNGVVGIHITNTVISVYNALHTSYDDGHVSVQLRPIVRGNVDYRRPRLYRHLAE